ncbi:helix-turn-helix domain-containing protein [Vibrio agarivorans]|uniref:helix-turn-helix domain-containing protein n=1 Tax=Vibrio agarivorans TaxID=153622 RepID=UPI0022329976|nr:helix-turn-helix domain-containing protein [Vibrio agarivorans]
MSIKLIRTDTDYKVAIARINDLNQGDPDALTEPDFKELEALTTLVDAYEHKHHPIRANVNIPHEVAKIALLEDVSLMAAWRRQLGLTQHVLATQMGVSSDTVRQMEKRDSKTRRALIEKAAKAMGINPEQLED